MGSALRLVWGGAERAPAWGFEGKSGRVDAFLWSLTGVVTFALLLVISLEAVLFLFLLGAIFWAFVVCAWGGEWGPHLFLG